MFGMFCALRFAEMVLLRARNFVASCIAGPSFAVLERENGLEIAA